MLCTIPLKLYVRMHNWDSFMDRDIYDTKEFKEPSFFDHQCSVVFKHKGSRSIQRVEISIFPLTFLLAIVTTVLPLPRIQPVIYQNGQRRRLVTVLSAVTATSFRYKLSV